MCLLTEECIQSVKETSQVYKKPCWLLKGQCGYESTNSCDKNINEPEWTACRIQSIHTGAKVIHFDVTIAACSWTAGDASFTTSPILSQRDIQSHRGLQNGADNERARLHLTEIPHDTEGCREERAINIQNTNTCNACALETAATAKEMYGNIFPMFSDAKKSHI